MPFRFVKKKFEELYFQSTAPDCVDRVFKIYRTTETLRRRNLFEAGLLWPLPQSKFLGRKKKKKKCLLIEQRHQILGIKVKCTK
jgi:TPP-dependent indolepyruvate ferredoxin oxidoreductase alpha subunit